MNRVATLIVLLVPSIALGQAVDADPKKVSNDQPDRPLQMPPASSEAKESFDDFERFVRRGAWERATKALYAVPDDQARRFVDGPEGFIISVARKRRAVLGSLSPEGLAAYRLFYDAEAQKLLDSAEGATEQATLERIFSSYFPTSVGDDAADRLGDLYFEQGRYDRAADCWLAVLRDRADSDLSPALLSAKAAYALARAGRRSEFEAIGRQIAERHADERITLAGRKARAIEHFRKAKGEALPTLVVGAAAGPAPGLSDAIEPAWQLRFGASVMAGMAPAEINQWESNALSGAVPRVAIEGGTLYANYLGYVFALDLANGKMLWRSSSFHNVDVAAMQDQVRMVDTRRFAILAAPGFVWTVARDLRDPNYQAPFLLSCRRTEGGEVVWKSSELPDYADLEIVGQPILAQGTIFVVAKTPQIRRPNQPPDQFAVAIRPHDGKVLWKTLIGTFRQFQRYFYYYMQDTSPQPRLTYRAGSLYVDTHVGVLTRLDAETGEIEWGYAYRTDPVEESSRFFFRYSGNREASTAAGAPFEDGELLLIKGAKAEQIQALSPDRMKVVWERPIGKSTRIVGTDDETIYLGGPELGAIDRKTKALQWSTHLPGGSEESSVLVRRDGIWQLTPRGVFEVDPRSGRVRKIFRADDSGGSGGDLYLTDRWVLTVSNRTISAYPRGGAGAGRAALEDAAGSKSRGTDE